LTADSSAIDKEAFNVGADSENYQKRTLIQLILNQVPEAAGLVDYVRRDEDPRDYRVRFGKIRGTLDFRPGMTVPDGIAEVAQAVRQGWISDPYHGVYRNSS
jgi:nucleoside-diphosphate-sugar epimerase